MESTATNPSVEVTPISQSSVDPIIEDSTNQTTTVVSSSEGTTVTSAPSSDPIDQVAANLQSANASVANFAANAIEVAREGAHEIETKTIDGINYAYDFAVVSKELAGEFAVATKVKAIQSKDYLLEKAKSSKDLALEKAVKSKEFVLEKAKSSKDFTVEKAVQSKEFVAEKTTEGKDLLLEKADQSKEFAAMELGKGKQFLSSKWAASRKAFLDSGRWVYSKSLQSYRFAFKKAQDGSMWVYHSFLAPFMVKSLLLTQSAAEKGKDGLSYVSTKAEELEKKLVDMPSDATDTLASMSGTPISAETASSLGTSQLENMSTFYSTLNQSAMGPKVAPVTGSSEEKIALIHQE